MRSTGCFVTHYERNCFMTLATHDIHLITCDVYEGKLFPNK